MTYRVLVTGPRQWADTITLCAALDDVLAQVPEDEQLVVVHGGAQGADSIAGLWTLRYPNDVAVEEVHAVTNEMWRAQGASSGHYRNQRMVDLGAQLCLACLMRCTLRGCRHKPAHDTHGTADCARRARRAGIPVREVAVFQ